MDDPGATKPNILIFLADDHGQWASSPYGNPTVVTPNLDRLAASGVLMEWATSPGPVCSPARASLLTGRLPSQHGIHDFLSESTGFERNWLESEIVLPELLQESGYRTALVGKWHLAANSLQPYRGFDRWISYDVGPAGWRNQYLHNGVVHLSDQGKTVTVDGFQSDHLVSHAIDFINQEKSNSPFFLLFAPTDTHAPYHGYPQRWVERYQGLDFDEVRRGERSHLPPVGEGSVAPDPLGPMLAQYYAAVSYQDEQLGVLLRALENRHQLENTLVIYTSDHGHMNGHHGLVGKANATLPQNMYEETIRVPMILQWPRGLDSPGSSLEIPYDHCDLFQTVLDVAGVELDRETMVRINSPGSSLLEYVQESSVGWRKFQYSEHGNVRLISDGRFKLIRRYPPLDPALGDEFYDLETDPRENVNLIEDHIYAERISSMSEKLDDHFERYQVPDRSGLDVMKLPSFNGREPWRRLAVRVNPRE